MNNAIGQGEYPILPEIKIPLPLGNELPTPVVKGGISLNQNWDKNGNIFYTDENGNRVNGNIGLLEKLKRKAQATAFNVNDWLNEQNPEHENYKQRATAAVGLVTAPLGLGEAATAGLARVAVPFLGKKLATMTAQGIGGGLVGGGAEGFTRGLLHNENPFVTGAQDAAIGGLLGGALGLGIGKIGQKMALNNIRNNIDDVIRQQQYFNDYIDGLNNTAKPMNELRGAKLGVKNGSNETLFDRLTKKQFLDWFGKSKMVDDVGNPLLFADGRNVYITDGFSNNGISKYTYKGSHRAPSYSSGDVRDRIENTGDVNLAEVVQGFHNQPKDYFSAMGPRYYAYNTPEGLESLNAIRRIKNGTADKITAYRAVPKDVNSDVLNNGDWITFSEGYAKNHGEHSLEGNYKIIKQEVSPNEVWWDGNDINEWGYDNGLPQNPDIMLRMENPYKAKVLPENWKQAREIRNQGYDGIVTDDGNYLVFEKDQLKRTSDVEDYNNIIKANNEKNNLYQQLTQNSKSKNIETVKKDIIPYKESKLYQKLKEKRSARQLDNDEFDYYKVMKRVNKMRSPKPIAEDLKKGAKFVIMETSEPYKKGEQNYVLNEIITNKNKQFLKDSEINIELPIYNPKKGEKGYFIHTVIKDKNGYKFKKVKSKDERIFKTRKI